MLLELDLELSTAGRLLIPLFPSYLERRLENVWTVFKIFTEQTNDKSRSRFPVLLHLLETRRFVEASLQKQSQYVQASGDPVCSDPKAGRPENQGDQIFMF